jgi:hypothetical protein
VSDRPPRLSVVIAASDSPGAVARTIGSLGLVGPTDDVDVELIVAAAPDRVAAPADLRPGVAWVVAEPGSGVGRLRRLGLDHARGDVVAFTEDSCRLDPGWLDAWRAALARPEVLAASGVVVPEMGNHPLDWAVFFCEYAPFLPNGHEAGRPRRLAGNGFAVRRSAAMAMGGAELHESEVHAACSATEGAVVVAGRAVCRHVRRYGTAQAIGDRLRFGRDYGRNRAGAWRGPVRWLGIVAGPPILLVQAARLVAVMARTRRCLGAFVETLPITLGLLTAWSVGEWLGWLGAAVRPPSRRPHGTTARPPARPAGRAGSPPPRCSTERQAS